MPVVARVLRNPPLGRWRSRLTMRDVLLAHWPVNVELLRPHVPLALDTFAGQAWVSVVLFDVSGARGYLLPPLPGLNVYAELQVRTYVTVGKKAGIWLISADATQPLVVLAGRWRHGLPYQHARATLGNRGTTFFYHTMRQHDGAARVQVAAHYTPGGPLGAVESGSLSEFLLERYYFYALGRHGELLRTEVNHRPWPVQETSARIAMMNLLPAGLRLPPVPPHLHYCPSLDVRIWPASPVREPSGESPQPQRKRAPGRDAERPTP